MAILPFRVIKDKAYNMLSSFALSVRLCCLLAVSFCACYTVEAKKYPFSIDAIRNVCVSRSTQAGTKMVKVSACGRTADAAIEQALLDAVVSLTFDGAQGLEEQEGCPAILYGGREVYYQHKAYFDKFFKKGEFLHFVEKVNSTNPMGADNVKTKNGRRIQIQLIVNWKGLADRYKSNGLKTIVSELSEY